MVSISSELKEMWCWEQKHHWSAVDVEHMQSTKHELKNGRNVVDRRWTRWLSYKDVNEEYGHRNRNWNKMSRRHQVEWSLCEISKEDISWNKIDLHAARHMMLYYSPAITLYMQNSVKWICITRIRNPEEDMILVSGFQRLQETLEYMHFVVSQLNQSIQ